jgi:hypothetical protein
VNFATADYFTDLSLICIALLYFSIDFDNWRKNHIRISLFASQVGLYAKDDSPTMDARDTEFILSIIRSLIMQGISWCWCNILEKSYTGWFFKGELTAENPADEAANKIAALEKPNQKPGKSIKVALRDVRFQWLTHAFPSKIVVDIP